MPHLGLLGEALCSLLLLFDVRRAAEDSKIGRIEARSSQNSGHREKRAKAHESAPPRPTERRWTALEAKLKLFYDPAVHENPAILSFLKLLHPFIVGMTYRRGDP